MSRASSQPVERRDSVRSVSELSDNGSQVMLILVLCYQLSLCRDLLLTKSYRSCIVSTA